MSKNSSVLTIILVALLSVAPVRAQTMFEEGVFKPYEDVVVSTSEFGNSLEHRILFFAHFTCPFCRGAHGYMQEWGDQLPAPYRLEIVPAVALPEHFPMAIAYYAVITADPRKLRAYERALYEELQGRRAAAGDGATYRRVAQRVGIDVSAFDQATQSTAVRGYVERAHLLTRLYGVEEVPTVIVGNRFKTGPARVQNDQASFVAILNGLISMHYRERNPS
jgi:protein-disulfide isomerase